MPNLGWSCPYGPYHSWEDESVTTKCHSRWPDHATNIIFLLSLILRYITVIAVPGPKPSTEWDYAQAVVSPHCGPGFKQGKSGLRGSWRTLQSLWPFVHYRNTEGPTWIDIDTLCSCEDQWHGLYRNTYHKVHNGKVDMKNLTFLSARRRLKKLRKQFSLMIRVSLLREGCEPSTGDFPILDRGEVEFMDVAPNQIVGWVASIIPSLEHDDANRAWWVQHATAGCSAYPSRSSYRGTGLEGKAAREHVFKFTLKVMCCWVLLMPKNSCSL